jgi:predicted helicase
MQRHRSDGIVHDLNDWAIEHDDPTYIFDLAGRVVTVSMRTPDIVEALPPARPVVEARP